MISCNTPVELGMYGAGLVATDTCAYCATEGAHPKSSLWKHYKTVLPVCKNCEAKGYEPMVARPYGK